MAFFGSDGVKEGFIRVDKFNCLTNLLDILRIFSRGLGMESFKNVEMIVNELEEFNQHEFQVWNEVDIGVDPVRFCFHEDKD